jgi:hypothetical protein
MFAQVNLGGLKKGSGNKSCYLTIYTLAYDAAVLVNAVKSYIMQANGDCTIKHFMSNKLECLLLSITSTLA